MPLILVVWSARPIHPLMRMFVRPQGPLVDALRANGGCAIRCTGEEGHLPLEVTGTGLRGAPVGRGPPLYGRRPPGRARRAPPP